MQDIANYIIPGKLWEAFDSEVQPVLLIDEIDKADIEFPNDLLMAEDIPPEALRDRDHRKALPPLYGALLKNEQDVHLVEQLLSSAGARRAEDARVGLKRSTSAGAGTVLHDAQAGRRAGLAHRISRFAAGVAGA